MPSQYEPGEFFARRGQSHPAVRLIFGETGIRKRLHHRRRGARCHSERRGDLAHRDQPLVADERRLALVNGLEIVLDRARREHARYYRRFACRCSSALRRPRASVATCVRSSRPLPTDTTSSPWRCRSVAIGDGRSDWSTSPRHRSKRALSILRPEQATSRLLWSAAAPALSVSM